MICSYLSLTLAGQKLLGSSISNPILCQEHDNVAVSAHKILKL